MSGKLISLIAVTGVALPLWAGVAEEPSLKELDALVGRWIGLRTTISEEQREWDARKNQWGAEIKLLEQESGALDNEMEKFSGAASAEEQERAKLLARKEAMSSELEKLKEVLDGAEQDMKGWETRLPESLRQPLDSLFKALPETQADAEKFEITKRVQTLVSLYTQIENLQHGFHTTREMLEVGNGQRRQVDVIYIGLARAFAVSLDNDWSAVGTPASKGWNWQAHPEHAESVRSAIDVFKRQKAAEIILLPMQLTGEAE